MERALLDVEPARAVFAAPLDKYLSGWRQCLCGGKKDSQQSIPPKGKHETLMRKGAL